MSGSNPRDNRVISAALDYRSREWTVLPLQPRTKRPIDNGWPQLRLSAAEIPGRFSGEENIGIALGAASHGLIDIDLDSPQTIALAAAFLPVTSARFGRASKRQSHWLYTVNAEVPYEKFQDLDGATLLEIRSSDHQTMVPPSTHPSGEAVTWDETGDPARVSGSELRLAAGQLAAAALLARHWPEVGGRNDTALALSGGLLRAGWPVDEVANFVRLVAETAGDEEAEDRERTARSTARQIDRDAETTGWPRLTRLLGADLVDRVRAWLVMPESHRGGSEKRKTSPATQIAALASNSELFHDSENKAYATITIGEHQETYALSSKGFSHWLSHEFYVAHRKAPTQQALKDALNVLQGEAIHAGPLQQVFVRLAGRDGRIYVDLGDAAWQAVEIDASGWRLAPGHGVKFIRPKGLRELPAPQPGGDLAVLRPFLNAADDRQFALLLGFIVASLRPTGPYPILVLNGEQGAAKTTAARVIKELVDPSKAAVRSAPREPRDLAIAAGNSWMLSYDNLSSLPPWLSDSLCQLSTGGGLATRELYTNDEEMIFEATRPVVLNGISALATRGDLLDRAIVVVLPPIADGARRTEAEFWSDLRSWQPQMLGALYDAVSCALANVESTHLAEKPRMADMVTWIVAAEPCLPIAPGTFLAAYTEGRDTADATVLDASPLAQALLKLVAAGEVTGTASELLTRLANVDLEASRSKSWPRDAARLGGQLRRLAPHLRRFGLEVEFVDSKGQRRAKRLIRILPVGLGAQSADDQSTESRSEPGAEDEKRF